MSATGAAIDLTAWRGRSETRADVITAAPLAARRRDARPRRPPPGGAVPAPGTGSTPRRWRQSEIGPDGHLRRGASCRRSLYRAGCGPPARPVRPLRVGDVATRRSLIADIASKSARSGPPVFVTVRHEISTAGDLALSEDHDIVTATRRRPAAPCHPRRPPLRRDLARTVAADDVPVPPLALTFNGHRIHYDRRYVTEVEGYPG